MVQSKSVKTKISQHSTTCHVGEVTLCVNCWCDAVDWYNLDKILELCHPHWIVLCVNKKHCIRYPVKLCDCLGLLPPYLSQLPDSLSLASLTCQWYLNFNLPVVGCNTEILGTVHVREKTSLIHWEQKCAFYSSGGEILCAKELVEVKYYVLNIYIHAVKPVFILSSCNKSLWALRVAPRHMNCRAKATFTKHANSLIIS